MKFRLDIQGLRALAVISVVIFHLDKALLPGGFLGVDIFFVISGFLISKSIITQIDQGSFDIFRFFQGRFKRIVPAYYFMLIFCTILTIYYFPATDFEKFFSQAKETLFFLSNQAFSSGFNYFGTQTHENLLLHTWSLSIEMQFYFFLPIALILVPKKWRKPIFIFVFLLLLAYTEYNLRLNDNQSKMYFSLPARVIEFMVGIFINFIPQPKKLSILYKNILGVIALLTIGISLFLISESSIFPGLTSLPCCFAVALIIWLEEGKVNAVLSASSLVYIGKISYSLYLWHWPILAFYRYKRDAYDIDVSYMVLLLIIFTVLSLISFYFIEEPLRKGKGKKLFQQGFIIVIATFFIWRGSHFANQKMVPIPEEYIHSIESINHNKYTGYQLIGDTSGPDHKILIIGDSHALSMLPFFEKLGSQNQLNFSFLTTNMYLPFPGFDDFNFDSEKNYKRYKKLSPIGHSLIKQADIIIIVRQWAIAYDFTHQTEYLKQNIDSNQEVVFMTDYPSLTKNPVRKYLSLTKPKNFESENLIPPVMDSFLLATIEDRPNFHLLNVEDEDFFKEAPYYNDTLIYYDDWHINRYGSESFAGSKGKEVADFLKSLKSPKQSSEMK